VIEVGLDAEAEQKGLQKYKAKQSAPLQPYSYDGIFMYLDEASTQLLFDYQHARFYMLVIDFAQ